MSNEYVQEITRLREQLEDREHELRQLRKALVPPHPWPDYFGLTPTEGKVLSTLYAASGRCTHGRLMGALYGDNLLDLADPQRMIGVMIHRLRKKLPHEVKIITIWGIGYELERGAKDFLKTEMIIEPLLLRKELA